MRWSLLLFLLLLSTASTLVAQNMDYESLETLFNEPVTTSATGSPQRTSDVPASMEIISAEQIARSGAVDIPGVLKQVTGVDVTRWTADHSDVAIRGYNKAFSSRLLVLVNGRQVYADHYGYTPWAALPVELEEIRQIEVVKGPNSALFGFNATGGVINIITKNPQFDDDSFLSLRGGTQDHRQLSIGTQWQLDERTAIRISGGARENDDFDTALRVFEQGIRQGDQRHSLRFDLHHRLLPNTVLELEGSRVLGSQTSMSPSYIMAYEKMEIRSLKSALHIDSDWGLTEAGMYRNWIDNRVFSSTTTDFVQYELSPEPVVVFDNQVTVFSFSQTFKPEVAHTVRLGAQYRDSALPTTPLSIGEVGYDILGFSGMWEWALSPDLSYTLALRRDALAMRRTGSLPEGLVSLSNADWDRDIEATAFNSALVWHRNESETLRLILARGQQLPNLFNLGGSLSAIPVPPEFQPPEEIYVLGLPGIEPTEVDNVELAWEKHLSSLSATVSLFYGTSKQLIADSGAFDPVSGIFGGPANIGDSKTSGVELNLASRGEGAWRWQLGYLYQDIDDDFAPEYPDSLSLINYEDTVAQHSVTASLGWSAYDWTVDLFLNYKAPQGGLRLNETFVFDPANPTALPNVIIPLSDFVTTDFNISYQLNSKLSVALSGRNLLHSSQVQTSGAAVERRLFGSLRYQF